MAPIRLVAATANPHKLEEIARVLGDSFELLPRPADLGDVVEDGETLLDNARLKAVAACTTGGAAAVADDTGLEVDALGGAPGVHSARFAGVNATYADNVDRLLTALVGIDPGRRTARFRTVALVHHPDGSEVYATGTVEGRIAEHARGGGGFGYDPVFIPIEGDGRTFAEMDDEKHALSHRGRAFRSLARKLAGQQQRRHQPQGIET
ncbi:MAG: RdgB/HAM1 family non-canonical purine NTP pyrophosphatase [Actinobacteria bacterium]|nr:RdgB/HAM1 family non-canonical purine NTP pyrophosphatase [Actinomycetota bacterium]